MVEIPDLPSVVGRLLGMDAPTTATALRLAKQRVRTHTPSVAACGTLADVLRVDEDRARSVLLTVEKVLAQARELEVAKAGDLFAFMGPVDLVTRPFCREHVGRVYTLEQIAALDNGQLDDVLLTGGGWDCRHHWLAISRFSDLAPLSSTDGRMPEIEAALAELARRPPTEWLDGRPPWSRPGLCPGPLRG